jgi:hypothetical protein
MGVVHHDTVVVTINGYVLQPAAASVGGVPEPPDVDGFRESMPVRLRRLLVGPVSSPYNDYVTYWLFGPDGSKEGWPEAAEAETWRGRFIELFSFAYPDGTSPYNVVHLRYGSEYGPAAVHYEFPAGSR